MTEWDNIYKNYEKGGEAWATLSEDIHPLFLQYLNEATFSTKAVLDIGCGTGKYLKFLQAQGFQTHGIDSSKTAVAMTKKFLGTTSDVRCEDMFTHHIAPQQYNLIIAISTIHHGTKEQVAALIEQIYKALKNDGKTFITLPDYNSAKKWKTFENHDHIAEGTYSPTKGPEKGLAHSFFTKEEIQQLFRKFSKTHIELDEIGRWIIWAEKYTKIR